MPSIRILSLSPPSTTTRFFPFVFTEIFKGSRHFSFCLLMLYMTVILKILIQAMDNNSGYKESNIGLFVSWGERVKMKVKDSGDSYKTEGWKRKLDFRILNKAFWLAYRDPCMHINVHIWIFIEGNLSKLLLF